MTSTFWGNYFDGQSAKPRQVTVEIRSKQRLYIASAETGFSKEIRHTDLHNMEEVGNSRLLLRFGIDGMELLDVRSEEFVKQFRKDFPDVKGGQNILERFAASGWKGAATVAAVLIGVMLLIYFFAIPWTGDMAARVFPQSYEEEMGAAMYKSVIREYSIDSAKTRMLNDLIKDVDFKTDYDLDIVVVDYDMKNAFAMPGGHIVVFSGIIDDMEAYPELIGLLAHEVSHVNKKHSLRALFRSLSSYIFISVLLNDINGLTTVVLENANNIKSLSFSRSLEEEADLEGLQIMFHNKIDPHGMVDLFRSLMEEGDMPEQMEFLSSHPVTKNRIEYIEQKIKESDCTVEHDEEMQAAWEKLIEDRAPF